ncbi:MAG TPA: hypothetical protein VJ739_08080 [Gemmataceae bacterium]|nr:hypothetical protein [Gemmataceae bacterium]
MKHGLTYLAVLLAAAVPAAAQPPAGAQPVKLTLSPAAAPSPALKYELLPELKDQTPGNAALEYYRAFSPEWWGHIQQPKTQELISNALQVPLEDLPKELNWVLNNHMLQQVDLAARREYCNWGMAERLRREGIGLLLPDVQSLRQIAALLAVRARLEIAEGRYDKALYTLQTGFSLGRASGNGVILIQDLVGMAVTGLMIDRLTELVQQPGAPNLYWALTNLPQPFFDLRTAFQGEKLWLFVSLPGLRDIETGRLPPQQLQNLMNAYTLIVDGRKATASERLEVTVFVLRAYPEAKRALIAEGRKPEEVEALPALQVVLIQSLHQYQRLQDDLFKWYGLPYWEARPHYEQAERRIRQARARLEGMPFIDALPAIQKVTAAPVRLERRVAALRIVEAIRLHAAAHDGKLPAALGDITEVPIPIDPMTGKPFTYQAAGDRATLSAPPPAGEQANPSNSLTYELTLRR